MHDHVRSFEEKNAALNPMYADNVEDFAFIVLHKLSNDEFEKYGTILEQIYINEIMQHIQLYNVSTYSEQHIYNNLLDIFKISDHTNKAFRNALGMYPCMLGSQPERRVNAFINRAIDAAMEREESNVGTD